MRPSFRAKAVEIPWTFSDSKGISKLSGLIKKLLELVNFPDLSCNCHANWIHLGQLSESVTGAFHFFGNPVVSVSKIKYMK